MEGFLRHPPPALLRTATLIGCVALLLGVAGVFYFGTQERSWREALPPDAATVLLRGARHATDVAVEVRWRYEDGSEDHEAGTPGRDPGLWVFRKAPAGTPLRLFVYRLEGDTRTLLHEQHAIFTQGAGFEVVLRRR